MLLWDAYDAGVGKLLELADGCWFARFARLVMASRMFVEQSGQCICSVMLFLFHYECKYRIYLIVALIKTKTMLCSIL